MIWSLNGKCISATLWRLLGEIRQICDDKSFADFAKCRKWASERKCCETGYEPLPTAFYATYF